MPEQGRASGQDDEEGEFVLSEEFRPYFEESLTPKEFGQTRWGSESVR